MDNLLRFMESLAEKCDGVGCAKTTLGGFIITIAVLVMVPDLGNPVEFYVDIVAGIVITVVFGNLLLIFLKVDSGVKTQKSETDG